MRLTTNTLKFLGLKQKWKCYLCNQQLQEAVFECDYIRSLQNGGADTISNLCLSLHDPNCHALKQSFDRDPDLYEKVTGCSKYFGVGPLAR